MKRIVFLARHGETDWNRLGRWQGHTDVPLSVVGRAQAAELAERLHGLGIVRITASDLSRAAETAQIVGRVIGVQAVALDPGLRERAFGRFEGMTREECALKYPDEWIRYRADPTLIPPGGEPHDQVFARMVAAVHRAAGPADGPGEAPALIVSHGGSLRALISSITGQALPPIGNVAVFRALLVDGGGLEEITPLPTRD